MNCSARQVRLICVSTCRTGLGEVLAMGLSFSVCYIHTYKGREKNTPAGNRVFSMYGPGISYARILFKDDPTSSIFLWTARQYVGSMIYFSLAYGTG